jgi:hypothetical protein
VKPRLVKMLEGQNRGLGVDLAPVSAEEREAMLALFRSVERVEDMWTRNALDAAARLVSVWRYDGRGDPLKALDELEAALRRLR